MKWQPIETYDELNLKSKPKYAVFYVKEREGSHYLGEMVVMERFYGSRIITHWMPLPDPPKP